MPRRKLMEREYEPYIPLWAGYPIDIGVLAFEQNRWKALVGTPDGYLGLSIRA